MIYGGIDPGNSGAMAIVSDDGKTLRYHAFKTYDKELDLNEIADWVRENRPNAFFVEKVHSMPKQGVSSSFTFGKAYGAVLGILAALKVPVVLVPPTKWKKAVLVDTDKSKDAAVAFVNRTYPGTKLIPLGGRKPNHNLADAICLAVYGHLREKGLTF